MEINKFSDIDLNDIFFDSLKSDYSGFENWFNKKSSDNSEAYVEYDEKHKLLDFLYLKIEDGVVDDVKPKFDPAKRLKVGTFKIMARATHRGERFIKKIMDVAMSENVDEIYVTIFQKHDFLIQLFSQYGFIEKAVKHHETDDEKVLVKDMRAHIGDIIQDYPKINSLVKKYVLAIYPKYHTRLFPDSILNNEKVYDLIRDVTYTNSIYKIYICHMYSAKVLKKGDLLMIYRTSDESSPAHYRSVLTSVCTVEDIKTKKDFPEEADFIAYAKKYSVFDENDLKGYYSNDNTIVIKMIYNFAFVKRVTKEKMCNIDINPDYWGFFQLTDDQFDQLLKLGGVNENYIID